MRKTIIRMFFLCSVWPVVDSHTVSIRLPLYLFVRRLNGLVRNSNIIITMSIRTNETDGAILYQRCDTFWCSEVATILACTTSNVHFRIGL
jgi:hypothetical protein